eukprot:Opistho-2@8459
MTNRIALDEMAKGDAWIAECDRLNRLADEVMADLNARSKTQRTGGSASKIVAGIQNKLGKLSADTFKLEDALIAEARQFRMPERELSRRKEEVQRLKNRVEQMRQQQRKEVTFATDDDDDLLDADTVGSGAAAPRAWGRETDESRSLSNDGLLQRQTDVMRQQDDGLEALSQSIRRQREIGVTLSDTLDADADLLDDLERGTDHTKSLLDRETKHVLSVTEKASSCGYIICILLLFVAIIVVVAIPT